MTLYSLPLAVTMAAAVMSCAGSRGSLYTTSPNPSLQKRGNLQIGTRLDRTLLSTLVIDYINLYRSKRNLPVLMHEKRAGDAALWMANYQSSKSAVTHFSEAPDMRRFGDRYRQQGGGNYSTGYENAGWYPLYDPQLERNYTYDEMARHIVDGWINSPSHHKALIVKAEGDGVIGLGVSPGSCKGCDGIFATMNVFFFIPEHRMGSTR